MFFCNHGCTVGKHDKPKTFNNAETYGSHIKFSCPNKPDTYIDDLMRFSAKEWLRIEIEDKQDKITNTFQLYSAELKSLSNLMCREILLCKNMTKTEKLNLQQDIKESTNMMLETFRKSIIRIKICSKPIKKIKSDFEIAEEDPESYEDFNQKLPGEEEPVAKKKGTSKKEKVIKIEPTERVGKRVQPKRSVKKKAAEVVVIEEDEPEEDEPEEEDDDYEEVGEKMIEEEQDPADQSFQAKLEGWSAKDANNKKR